MQVFVLRGIPGCGKSSAIEGFKKFYPDLKVAVVSADEWMTNNKGEYSFDHTKLKFCHYQCFHNYQDIFLDAILPEDPSKRPPKPLPDILFVDNTNITLLEAAPYIAVAQDNGIPVTLITFITPPEDCMNTHGVSTEKVFLSHLQFLEETTRIPSWWTHQIRYGRKPHQVGHYLL